MHYFLLRVHSDIATAVLVERSFETMKNGITKPNLYINEKQESVLHMLSEAAAGEIICVHHTGAISQSALRISFRSLPFIPCAYSVSIPWYLE